MRTTAAHAVAETFTTLWGFLYGPPSRLFSDIGTQFGADVCRLLCISNLYTKAYHPKTNSQAEQFNRTLLAALRHYIADHPRTWDEFMDALMYAYNTKPHSSTGFALFELVVVRPPPTLSIKARRAIMRKRFPRDWCLQWKH